MNVWKQIKTKLTYNKIAFLLVLIVLITLPLNYAFNSISIVILFLFSLFILVFKKRNVYRKPNAISVLLISVYMVALVTLFWSGDISRSLKSLSTFLSYLILPISFYILNSSTKEKVFNRKTKERIVRYFSFSLSCYAMYCMIIGSIHLFKTKEISQIFYHTLSTNLNMMNAIFLSVFVAFGFIYFLTKKNKTAIEVACLIVLLLFLMLLSSKMVIIITLLLSLIYMIKNGYKKQYLLKIKHLVIVVCVGLIAVIASKNVRERILNEFAKTNINEVLVKKDFGDEYLWTGAGLRVFQIKAFFEIVSEEKGSIKGLGLNNSQEKLNRKYVEYNLYKGFQNYHFHNQYIQIFSELGLLGLLLLLSIFYLVFKQAVLNKDFLFFSFIFVIATICMTDTFLWKQKGMVFFITIVLLFYEAPQKPQEGLLKNNLEL